MFKAYLVDDEPLARDELKYLLRRTRKVEIVGESDNYEDAVSEISSLQPNIVFLDIELSEDHDNGLSIAKELEKIETAPAIVFATAYDEYAINAFELNAIDYILKPFDEERIEKTLEKTKKVIEAKQMQTSSPPAPDHYHNGKIPIVIDDRIILLNDSDILYLESRDGKCIINTLDNQYPVNEALVVWEKKIRNPNFMRVHRSYIVNLDQIAEIEPWFHSTYNLIMKDHSKVPVSRTYVKQLKQVIGI